jgi:hypothetical protein
MKFAPSFVCALITLGSCLPVRAGSSVEATSSDTSQFDSGRHELQIGAGVFVSFQTTSATRPQINDVGGHLRLGWMLSTPSGEGFWRGNTELLIAAQGSGIVKGPGSVLAGGSLVLRRNFVQPASRWVPYAQLEAGGLYNDGYRERIQHAFGEAFEFQLGGGIGLRYLCTSEWAMFLEADYRHISNAGLADRNTGTNAVGGFIGISRLY